MSFNQTQANLQIAGSDFEVLSFTSNSYGLGKAFEFQICALSAIDLCDGGGSLSHQLVTLTWQVDGDQSNQVAGFVNHIERSQFPVNEQGQYRYQITLASPWVQTHYRRRCQAWAETSVKAVIEEVFNKLQLGNYQLRFITQRSFDDYPSFIQFNETDAEFLESLLPRFGLFFYSVLYDNQWQLIIADDSRFLPNFGGTPLLHFAMPGGFSEDDSVAFALEAQYNSHFPKQVILNDYDCENPSADLNISLTSRSTTPSNGEEMYNQLHFMTPSAGQQLAQDIMDSWDCQRFQLKVRTNCRNIMPGQVLKITDHPIDSYNQSYRVIAIQHDFNQSPGESASKKKLRYSNELTLIPAAQCFHLPIDPAIKRQQRMHDLFFQARVVGQQGETDDRYPQLDELGRYRVKYHFVREQDNQDRHYHSPPLRLQSPYGGQKSKQAYGTHFALRTGTDVVVGLQNGDAARPFIVGVLSHDKQADSVTNKNSNQHRIRTFGGNEFIMNDDEDKRFISFNTQNQEQHFALNAWQGQHSIVMQNKTGSLTHYAKGDITQTSDDQFTQAGNNHTITSASHELQTEKGDVALMSKQTQTLKAKKSIALQTLVGDITGIAGGNYTVNTKGPVQFLSKQGNLKVSAEKAFSLEASELHILAPEIQMGAAGSIKGDHIEIGSMTLKAPSIDIYQPGGGSAMSSSSPVAPKKLAATQKQRTNPIKLFHLIAWNLRAGVGKPYFKPEKQANDPYQRSNTKPLTQKEIVYLKSHCKSNVTIFIHGFSVEYGKFGGVIDVDNDFDRQMIKNTVYSQQTIYRDPKLIKTLFPSATINGEMDFSDDDVNGTGAHNWWLHMEYNLNKATGQLDEISYSNYARMIHIAWQGDPSNPLDYLAAVKMADETGPKIVGLIEQLQANNIQINIIAHSLGNGVLMKLLDALGEQGKDGIVNHAFMWEAAVPDDAFSSPATNKAPCGLYKYPNAVKAVKNITVLYSEFDNVLGPFSANEGTDSQIFKMKATNPTESALENYVCQVVHWMDQQDLPQKMESPYHFSNYFDEPTDAYLNSKSARDNFYSRIKKIYQPTDGKPWPGTLNQLTKQYNITHNSILMGLRAVLRDAQDLTHSPLTWGHLGDDALSDVDSGDAAIQTVKNLITWAVTKVVGFFSKTVAKYYKKVMSVFSPLVDVPADETAALIMAVMSSDGAWCPAPAMGFVGASSAAQKKLSKQKLKSLSQHNWLTSHSAMKIPTAAIMKHVYRDTIFRAHGYKFGQYKQKQEAGK